MSTSDSIAIDLHPAWFRFPTPGRRGRKPTMLPALLAVLMRRLWAGESAIQLEDLLGQIVLMVNNCSELDQPARAEFGVENLAKCLKLASTALAIQINVGRGPRHGPYSISEVSRHITFFVAGRPVSHNNFGELNRIYSRARRPPAFGPDGDIDPSDNFLRASLEELIATEAAMRSGVDPAAVLDSHASVAKATSARLHNEPNPAIERGPGRWGLDAASAVLVIRLLRRSGASPIAERRVTSVERWLNRSSKYPMLRQDRRFWRTQLRIERAACQRTTAERKATESTGRSRLLESARDIVEGLLVQQGSLDRTQRIEALLLSAEIRFELHYDRIKSQSLRDRSELAVEIFGEAKTLLSDLNASYVLSVAIRNFELLTRAAYSIGTLYGMLAFAAIPLFRGSSPIGRQWHHAIDWLLLGMKTSREFHMARYGQRCERMLLFCLRNIANGNYARVWQQYSEKLLAMESANGVLEWIRKVYDARLKARRKVDILTTINPIAQLDFLREAAAIELDIAQSGFFFQDELFKKWSDFSSPNKYENFKANHYLVQLAHECKNLAKVRSGPEAHCRAWILRNRERWGPGSSANAALREKVSQILDHMEQALLTSVRDHRS